MTDADETFIPASKRVRSIDKNRRAQIALRESEERLAREVAGARALQAISTRLISEVNRESLFAHIIDAAMVLMGADASGIQLLAPDGKTLVLLGWRNFPPPAVAHWRAVRTDAGCTCAMALREQKRILVSDIEACEFLKDTQDLVEYRRSGVRAFQVTPLYSRAGRPLGIISTHWGKTHAPTDGDFRLFDVLARQAADIIERTRAEEALRDSEEKFRAIANTAPVIIWMSDADNRCEYVNQPWLDFTGQTLEDVIGEGWTQPIHPEDIATCVSIYEQALARRDRFQMYFRLRRVDGEYRWIVSTGAPRFHGDGAFAGYVGSSIDVTERRQAEEALATINQRLADAQADERARIARELHDDVVQRLVGLGWRLGAACDPAPASESAVQEIESVRAEVMALAKDVQALSHRLHPAWMEFLGIAASVRSLCREMSRQAGFEIVCRVEDVPDGLSRENAVCLHRVLQEALQNAVKHSRAAKVEVVLRAVRDEIEMTVKDFGVGFDPDARGHQGLGLTSMKERLKAAGGRLSIASQQDGTTLQAYVPIAQGGGGGLE